MHFPPDQLAALRAFGYTEAEAHFLYLVAAHSGYFTLRQFLQFAQAKSGKRNAKLVAKLFGLGHTNARRYTRRSHHHRMLRALQQGGRFVTPAQFRSVNRKEMPLASRKNIH